MIDDMRKWTLLVENLNARQIVAEAGAGPARIAQHVRDGNRFLMLSAMRSNLDRTANKKRTLALRKLLNAIPVTYIETTGEYHEDGATEPSPESSFFIMPRNRAATLSFDRFLAYGRKLMRTFGQDSILYGDGSTIHIEEKDGTSFTVGDTATFDPSIIKALPGFSKIKDRQFSFAGRADIKTGGVAYGNTRQNA